MKFARLGDPGREQPAVQPGGPDSDGKWYSLAGLTADIDGTFLEAGGVDRVRDALAAGNLAEITDAGALRTGAPLARPGAVVGIGLNYAGHAAESGAAVPEVPVVFLKPTNTVAGPFDDAPIPPLSRKYDWEVELAVVIGRRTSYLTSVDEAADCIAGYVLANDLSERDYQLPGAAGQWVKGKSLPASTPLGPWASAPIRSSTSRRSSATRSTTSPALPASARRRPSSCSKPTARSTICLEHAAEVPGAKGKKLVECREQALLSRQLVRLDRKCRSPPIGTPAASAASTTSARRAVRRFRLPLVRRPRREASAAMQRPRRRRPSDANYQLVDTPEKLAELVARACASRR